MKEAELLQVGDVILLEKGMSVYTMAPDKFFYDHVSFGKQESYHEVSIGAIYRNEMNIIESKDVFAKDFVTFFEERNLRAYFQKIIDAVVDVAKNLKTETWTFDETGEYVVVDTTFDGGSSGRWGGDWYPDGHHLWCKKLKNGNFDENGVEVNFYQTGADYLPKIPNIKAIDKINLNIGLDIEKIL